MELHPTQAFLLLKMDRVNVHWLTVSKETSEDVNVFLHLYILYLQYIYFLESESIF